MPRRKGTEKDVQSITLTFAELQFEVEVLDNPTFDDIKFKLLQIQQMSNLSCLALFILTHGENDGLLYSYDENYMLSKHIIPELLPNVCPSLAGKPKMIFIQACQGQDVDSGVEVKPNDHTETGNIFCIYNMQYYTYTLYKRLLF